MNHLKLFEELNIPKEDFPKHGYELNTREKQILEDLVGEEFLKEFEIIKEDNYYPSDWSNEAIKSASKNGHSEIVKLLIRDSRVRKKLRQKEIEEYEAY